MTSLLDRPPRVAAVWCPDWPVTAAVAEAGIDPELPAAVVVANRVVACSHAARRAGVKRGLRRREAQGRCPEVAVLPRAELAEVRAFEPVVRALESIAPGVEVRWELAALRDVSSLPPKFGARLTPADADAADLGNDRVDLGKDDSDHSDGTR